MLSKSSCVVTHESPGIFTQNFFPLQQTRSASVGIQGQFPHLQKLVDAAVSVSKLTNHNFRKIMEMF